MQSVTSNAVCKAFSYSVTEQFVGYWIDGKKIYRKIFQLQNHALPYRQFTSLCVIDNCLEIISFFGTNLNNFYLLSSMVTSGIQVEWSGSQANIRCYQNFSGGSTIYYTGSVIVEYLKATD